MEEEIFQEIQNLKANLQTGMRGEAIRLLRERFSSLLENCDWAGAENFFRDFHQEFCDDSSSLGIVKGEFNRLVDKLITRIPDFQSVVRLNRLMDFSWFDLVEDANYKRGWISEHLARFSQRGELIELRKARRWYRLAQRHEDTRRVQAVISEKAKSFNIWAPNLPPDHLVESIRHAAEESRQKWLDQSSEIRMEWLIYDGFGIRPSPPNRKGPCGNIFSSGLLEELGVISSIEVSSDGRISFEKSVPLYERIDFESWDFCHRTFLDSLTHEIKSWLLTQENEAQVYERVSSTLQQRLEWDENLSQHFNAGLTGWISGLPEIALSFWLPFFEAALRLRLVELGENVVSSRERMGVEDFATFDSLLNKALGHYEDSTVRYWRRVFSTENGLGWNLRNDFCHGLLPMKAMRLEMLPLAVFFAFLFLLQSEQSCKPSQQDSSEA